MTNRGPSEAPLSGGLFFCALSASCVVVVGLLVAVSVGASKLFLIQNLGRGQLYFKKLS